MRDIVTPRRPSAVLASVVLAQVLLLAFQIKRDQNVRLIRYWAVGLLTPVERAATWTFASIGGVWKGYIALRRIRGENERLRNEVVELRLRNRDLESRVAEAQRLGTLLGFREAHPEAPMLAAQVIGASADPTSHTLFIDRGERDRLRRDLPVITPDGIVGKILYVFPTTAQVLLASDRESGVGALFGDTRTHGIISGTGDPELRMDYVVNDEEVRAGELIVTSGEDRIFPKDLPIGTVIDAVPGNPFQVIRVRPAARLDRLEDVLVLLSRQQLAPQKPDESSRTTSTPVSNQTVPQGGTPPASVPSKGPGPVPNNNAVNAAKPAAGASKPGTTATKPASGGGPGQPKTPAPGPPVPQP
jgi:rod shape-determining protein MreC